jgi:hypothetical protein
VVYHQVPCQRYTNLLLIILLWLVTSSACGTSTPTNVPILESADQDISEYGGILALAIDPVTPTTLYAGTEHGTFKSMDGGGSWRWVTSLPDTNSDYVEMLHVDRLVIDLTTPTTLYAATWGSGVLKSTDGGESWNAVNTGLPEIEIRLWTQ